MLRAPPSVDREPDASGPQPASSEAR
jgi:hypothetical protein